MTPKDFSKDVRKHVDFKDTLAKLGIVEHGQRSRFTCFMKPFEVVE